MKPQYLQNTYIYAPNGEQPPFACTMTAAPGTYIFHITFIGDQGTEVPSMPGNSNWLYRFAPQLLDMQKTFEGKTFQPLDAVRQKFGIYMAAKYSHHEKDGLPVKVGTVPADWSYPHHMPGWMDDSLFK